MAQYRTGTVTVTNASAVVTGSGTSWSANIDVGDLFTISGGFVFYEVAAVDSDTQITLSAAYSGTTDSGLDYAISRDFTSNQGYPLPQPGDIEVARVIARSINEIDVDVATFLALVNDATSDVSALDARVDTAETDIAALETEVQPLNRGGTGETTAAAARTALGSTTVGDAVFIATDAAAGRTALELGTAAVLDAGNLTGLRNLLINATFAVNQREYASGTATTAANQYTIDRWRVVTSGENLTFSGEEITAPAGGVEQVIEGANIETGTHVLNWTGTATATVNGAVVAKGGTFDLTTGTDCTVRFIGGTVSKPQLERGTIATPFERREDELLRCRRYCHAGRVSVRAVAQGAGEAVLSWVQTRLRAPPAVTLGTPALSANADGLAVEGGSSGRIYDSGFGVQIQSVAAGAFYSLGVPFLADAEIHD